MKRLAAPALLGALLLLTACRHDGRDLAAPNQNNRTILPTTTIDPDSAEPGDTVGLGNGTGDTLPAEDLGGDDQGGDVQELGMYIELPFDSDTVIQDQYTCNGANVSPAIRWFNLPEGTVEVAIQVTDLESDSYVHWVIAGLDPASGGIGEGEVPIGAVQATNSAGTIGYTGPCPPHGETHNYLFEVSALDQQIELPNGTDADTLMQAIGAATIDSYGDSGTVTR